MAVSLTKPQEEQFEHLKQQYANKGFVVTKVDDLINWARTGSLHWLTFVNQKTIILIRHYSVL